MIETITISSGILTKILECNGMNLTCKGLNIGDIPISRGEAPEFDFQVAWADPNQPPQGISADTTKEIVQKNNDQAGTDGLSITQTKSSTETTTWKNATRITSTDIPPSFQLSKNISENTSLKIDYQSSSNSGKEFSLAGLVITVVYKIYPPHPVIRKWITVVNNSSSWIRINQFKIDLLSLHPDYNYRTDLTPSERGACACLIGCTNHTRSKGILLASEVPSALRSISPEGSMGYSPELFEWILGPGESFTSEPIFYFGVEGESYKTKAGCSNSLDRSVEGPLQQFLESEWHIPAKKTPIPGPVWCTWTNFVANINDEIIRRLADLAAQCGFQTFQIDAGWSESPDPSDWTTGSVDPHPTKFPNFAETCDYIRKTGMRLGLWLSCFRSPQSRDFRDVPDGRILPWVKRGKAFGMSFASRWRDYYADTVVDLAKKFGAVYFKQDLTSIKFGDFAAGHESNSLKESYLRGLRGLLASQRKIKIQKSDVWTMLSHEIYWGTPGVPFDLAALQSVCGYHIPPNDYTGCGLRRQQWNNSWKTSKFVERYLLRLGCWHARQRFFAHRGLPLYTVEYFGAATININHALTPEIQDRQICSWLMGMPSVYAGDLFSLDPRHILHYRNRFDLLKRLQEQYDIYHQFQFSGVPVPTEWGWHWWGKLNFRGEGVVVVIRGKGGWIKKQISIPWVNPSIKYLVHGCFSKVKIGVYTGEQLQCGEIRLKLPRSGQEILELSIVE